jgi:hypothetical protein
MDRDSPRPYTLPRAVQERLTAALKRFRNRQSALTLATFLGRYWSAPGRVVQAFHIDRRALAEHAALGLSEDRIRGAIKTLEAIGFLDRALTSGSAYKPTEDGLRRKPIKFHFGAEYGSMFLQANRRAAAVRERHSEAVRSQVLASNHRASTALPEAQISYSPKSKAPPERSMHMGEVTKTSGFPAKAFEPNSKLEAALARFEEGFRHSRGG